MRRLEHSEIICNACHGTFDLTPGRVKTRIDKDVHFGYLSCPLCGAVFLINVTNKQLRGLIAKHSREQSDSPGRQRVAKLAESLKNQYRNRFKELFPKAFFDNDV